MHVLLCDKRMDKRDWYSCCCYRCVISVYSKSIRTLTEYKKNNDIYLYFIWRHMFAFFPERKFESIRKNSRKSEGSLIQRKHNHHFRHISINITSNIICVICNVLFDSHCLHFDIWGLSSVLNYCRWFDISPRMKRTLHYGDFDLQ